jgi:hypothetical protein
MSIGYNLPLQLIAYKLPKESPKDRAIFRTKGTSPQKSFFFFFFLDIDYILTGPSDYIKSSDESSARMERLSLERLTQLVLT